MVSHSDGHLQFIIQVPVKLPDQQIPIKIKKKYQPVRLGCPSKLKSRPSIKLGDAIAPIKAEIRSNETIESFYQ